MTFGTIDHIILFGGGQRLVNFLSEASGFAATVFSAPRMLSTVLDDEAISVEDYFRREGIVYHNVERLADVDMRAHVTPTTLGISFGAPWIFSEEFIALFGGRLINGHGTRLPKNRGGASYSWQVMRGDRTGCHLFHLIDGGIDTGAIVYANPYAFPASCTTPQDYNVCHRTTERAFFREFVARVVAQHDFVLLEQDETVSTYFPRLSTEHHGWVDWHWDAPDVVRFICAFDEPYAGASTLWRERRVRMKGAVLDTSEERFHPYMSGIVYRRTDARLWIAATNGSVVIASLCDEQGGAVLRDVRPGDRLITPSSQRDAAETFRAVYTPLGLKSVIHVDASRAR